MQTQFNELTDAQWKIIEEILNDQRKRKHNLREVINGILELLRKGCQWRNLNHPKLSWQVIYYYFRKWKKDGTLERLNSELNKKERKGRVKKRHRAYYILIVNQLSQFLLLIKIKEVMPQWNWK